VTATLNIHLAFGFMTITNGLVGVGMWALCMEVTAAWGLVEGLTTPYCKKPACYEMLRSTLDLAVLVNAVINFRVP
jgi:hypothetical protein